MKKRSVAKKKGSVKKQGAKLLYTVRRARGAQTVRLPSAITVSDVSQKSVSSMMTFAAKYDVALRRLAKR